MAQVKGYNRPVRVCENCHAHFYHRHGSSGLDDATTGTAAGSNQEDTFTPYHTLSQLSQFFNSLYSFKLVRNDPMHNQNVRQEFYYERTPNTALCLSLADLLVSRRQAAGVILDCCHTVSAQLVPDSQGRVNEELDHHFVIR